MLLEFKSKEAALKAFSLNDINIDMFRNHVLFDGCEIHRHPGSYPFIIVFYYSGLEGYYVHRCVTLKHYDKYVRLIPQEEKYHEYMYTDGSCYYYYYLSLGLLDKI